MIKKLGRPILYPEEKPRPAVDIGECIEKIREGGMYYRNLSLINPRFNNSERSARIAESADYLVEYLERVVSANIELDFTCLREDLIEYITNTMSLRRNLATDYFNRIIYPSNLTVLNQKIRRGVGCPRTTYDSPYDPSFSGNGRKASTFGPGKRVSY